jgi:hypothetical protein
MSDQNKNAQPSTSKDPKNAGGVDNIEESEDRVEGDDPSERADARRAGGGRPSPKSDKPISPDRRSGSERKS